VTVETGGITAESVNRIWPVAPPRSLRRMKLGTNNRSFVVECNDGTYFLKIYDNAPDPSRCLFEHRITAAIAARNPPFAVPEIILSRSGETHIHVGGRFHALTTFIPGSVVSDGDPDETAACGRALADLHVTLAKAELGVPEAGPRTFGDLKKAHPLVQDPERAIRDATGDDDLSKAAVAIVSLVQSQWLALTTGWPLTWIHGDFYPSNVLRQGHRVTGIVDFEFAGAGFRAMDVAIGLSAFAFEGSGWGILADRFATGYLSRLDLTSEEIEAIPTLILMREATSLVHWTGRHRQGMRDWPGVGDRARKLVRLAEFLDRNGAGLVERLHAAGTRAI